MKKSVENVFNVNKNVKEGYVDDIEIVNEIYKRVPFLKDFVVHVKKISQLEADKKDININNISIMNSKGKIMLLTNYNPISSFGFRTTRIDGNRKIYTFSVKNVIKIIPPENLKKETLNSLLFAIRKLSIDCSFTEEIVVNEENNDVMMVSDEKFDEMINKINKAFYHFFEITDKTAIPDF